MIRVVQRHLIIPRGDTGTFSLPALKQVNTEMAAVFVILDLRTQSKIFEKLAQIDGEIINIEFTHNDTVNLPAGEYVWDVKFYVEPVIIDGKLVDGKEIDSYYAAFKLPVCEIRQTGDDLLVSEDAPKGVLSPSQLNILTAAINATNEARDTVLSQVAVAQAEAERISHAIDDLATVASSGSYTDLINTPTKVSQFENDSGYLTTEVDPTVPQWAKAAVKPSYTPQEVGAMPANTYIPNKTSDLTNDSNYAVDANYVHTDNNYTTEEKEKLGTIAAGAEVNVNADWNAESGDAYILNKPTNVSAFNNDVGYLTEHQDISGKANAADLAAVATSGSYNDLDNKPFIPSKVSDLTDDSGHYTKPSTGIPASDLEETYLTSFTETDPTVPSWAKQTQKPSYTAAEVGATTPSEVSAMITEAIRDINSFDMAIVQVLPTEDISTHTIYLVPKNGEENDDIYDEYVYINGNWEMVGNTQIDLSNYVQKTDYAKADNAGVVKVNGTGNGVGMKTNGTLVVVRSLSQEIKNGNNIANPIVPYSQHESTFYGLAKAAGDATQSQSDNAIGTYTNEAKAAIQNMFGIDLSLFATKADTILTTTLSRGRKSGTIIGTNSFAFGNEVEASGGQSFATGNQTIASGGNAHAEGGGTLAKGGQSHAEGGGTIAIGANAHAEGYKSIALGSSSHAEGYTLAIANYSHIEGQSYYGNTVNLTGEANTTIYSYTIKNNQNYIPYIGAAIIYNNICALITDYDEENHLLTLSQSLIEALDNTNVLIMHGYTSGIGSHAEGKSTIAASNYQHVQGQCNIIDNTNTYADIIGNGSATTSRSNAYALDWSGNGHYMGSIYVGANADSTGGTKVLCEADFATDLDIQNIINGGAGA